METTILLTITAIYSGFFYKQDPRYTPEFGYWVEVRHNHNYHATIWRESFKSLQLAVSNQYGVRLPNESEISYMNYGTPYNVAIIYPPTAKYKEDEIQSKSN